MYIAPNSTIKILSNVKLKKDLSHTFLFGSSAAQSSYFSSKTAYILDTQSYQRSYSNKMRIEKKVDDLYNCNYLMFQNTSFGSKWFYAFITNVEYVNNVTTEITYEIDPMQTFLFDGQLNPCFVEREHAESDNIGENILPEPVELGEYRFSGRTNIIGTDKAVVIAISDEEGVSQGRSYDGIYSGCDLWVFKENDYSSINSKLENYIGSPESVLNIYTIPSLLVGGSGNIPTGGKRLNSLASSSVEHLTLSKPTGNESFDSYTNVKNKKLFTYPYNYLMISNFSGQSLNLRYEWFTAAPELEIEGTFLNPVKLVCRPCGYKGLPSHDSLGGYSASDSEQITLESYPLCSWNVDTYKSWVAQNSIPIVLNTVSGVAQAAIAGKFSTSPTGSLISGAFGQIAGLVGQFYQASVAADQCRGNTNSGNVNVAKNKQKFVYERAHVSRDYARQIDDFFTMYGYAQNRIKTPNRNARPEFTYVKTVGSNITGNIPANYLEQINAAYDKGITFWNNPENIYNYNVDNSPYDY